MPLSLHLSRRGLSSAALVVALAPSAHAQAVREIALGAQFERVSHEFEGIVGVRELSDGRAIVLDPRNRAMPLTTVDFGRGIVTQIGRRGDGPGEYRDPRSLASVGRDSTLISDWQLRRWLVLAGSEIVGLIPREQEPAATVGRVLAGGDTRGRVLGVVGFGSTGPVPLHGTSQADSGLVIAGDIHRRRVDTVARIRGGGARLRRVQLVRPEVDINPVQLTVNPLLAPDQAVMFPDGWIAVARQSPYRVDWLDPTGAWHRGPDLGGAVRPLTEADRRLALSELFPSLNTSQTPTSVFPDWPAVLPPFLDHALVALPSGHLLIRRAREAGASTTQHDVIDRYGVRVAILSLPIHQRLLGAGPRGLYIAVTDGDGLQELRRYSLPSLR